MTIRPPDAREMDLLRNVTVGQLAQAGGEMLRMMRQNRIEWRGEVPEQSLPSLEAGQRVTITSVDGRDHEGTIRVVSPTVDPITHNGLVYVDTPGVEDLNGQRRSPRCAASSGASAP